MERRQPAEPHRAVELLEHRREAPGRADVVPRGEQVAGVHAEGQALGPADPGEDRAELLRPRAEDVTGSGRVLEGDLDPPSLGATGDVVQRGDEPIPPLLGAVAPVGSRVEHDEGKAEALGALEVVEEGVHGARPLVR